MWSAIKLESLKCYLNWHLALTDILHAIVRLVDIYDDCTWVRRCEIFSKYIYVLSLMWQTLISTQFSRGKKKWRMKFYSPKKDRIMFSASASLSLSRKHGHKNKINLFTRMSETNKESSSLTHKVDFLW